MIKYAEGLAWRISTFTFVLLFWHVSPAVAEVCDKVNPRWDPADGPISPFGEAYYTLTSPISLILAVLIVIVFLINSRWLYLIFSVPVFLYGFLLPILFREDPGINYLAVQEGCRSETYVAVSFVYIIAAVLVLRGVWKFVKTKKKQ